MTMKYLLYVEYIQLHMAAVVSNNTAFQFLPIVRVSEGDLDSLPAFLEVSMDWLKSLLAPEPQPYPIKAKK